MQVRDIAEMCGRLRDIAGSAGSCGTLREVAGHCGKVRDSIGSGGTAGIAGVVGVAGYYRALVGRRNQVFRVIDCYARERRHVNCQGVRRTEKPVFQSVDNPLTIDR